MVKYIVRYGLAPGETADEQGELHADFTEFKIFESENPLEGVVRGFWDQVVSTGFGHMLVGSYGSLKYEIPQTNCHEEALLFPELKDGIVLEGYTPLFAVARTSPSDEKLRPANIALDYRGTKGPGDPEVKPQMYDPAV